MNPLAGKHVVVTRALHQTLPFVKLLEQHQAIPIVYPCIAIAPPEDTTVLDQYLHDLASFDWLLFTSANTVHALADRFHALNRQPDWTQTQVGVVGSKTATVFQKTFGHPVDFMPETFTGESLAETLPIQTGARVLVPQSELADETMADILASRGAITMSITAYRTVVGEGGADVPDMLRNNAIDIVTFTSPSSVENFVTRIQPLQAFHLPTVCIGPTTADAASDIGFTNCFVPNDYTLKGMLEVLLTYLET